MVRRYASPADAHHRTKERSPTMAKEKAEKAEKNAKAAEAPKKGESKHPNYVKCTVTLQVFPHIQPDTVVDALGNMHSLLVLTR